jgi:hypothetical protein
MNMKKMYTGSCHCGAVRFSCELDLAEGMSKCNCSICAKTRFWKAVIPADAFRLIRGEVSLSNYQFGSNSIHHHFCRRCGLKPFGRGHAESLGEFYAINLACLDDVSPVDLAEAPVRFEDGKNNDWESPPAETRHL